MRDERRALSAALSSLIPHPSSLLKRRRARNDLDYLARDARLPDAVHVERQRLYEFARVLRRRVHRRHARALLARNGFEQSAIDLRLDEAREESAEDFGGRLFVDVINEGLRARVACRLRRLFFGARDGENLLDDDALRDDGAELAEDDKVFVESLVFGEAAHHVARDFERLGVFDPSLARQADVLADYLDVAASEEVAPFATDGQKLDGLVGVLAHEGLRGLDEVRVEGTGQPLVCRDEDEQVALVAASVEQGVVEVFARVRGEVCEHFGHLHCEGSRGDGAILRALQLRSRDHLHGLRYLLRVLDRLDASANVEEVSHNLSDECGMMNDELRERSDG